MKYYEITTVNCYTKCLRASQEHQTVQIFTKVIESWKPIQFGQQIMIKNKINIMDCWIILEISNSNSNHAWIDNNRLFFVENLANQD